MDKPKVMLKFKHTIPIRLRTALVDFGFQYYSSQSPDWVIFSKPDHIMEQNRHIKGVKSQVPQLGPPWQPALEARMTKIIDSYLDPYSQLGAIKAQIIHLARATPNREQERWCLEWMDKHLDEGTFVPPWEDPNHEPNLGAC